jgi:hypothetical protein
VKRNGGDRDRAALLLPAAIKNLLCRHQRDARIGIFDELDP